MSAETRRELLALLEDLGRHYPEMRFGQLMLFLARLARGPELSAVYDIEDAELIRAAQSALGEGAVSRT
jgi:hypothetical protein